MTLRIIHMPAAVRFRRYRAKPLRKHPSYARLQYQVWWIFWKDLAIGKTAKMKAEAEKLQHRNNPAFTKP